jgi:general transcription factor IIIA
MWCRDRRRDDRKGKTKIWRISAHNLMLTSPVISTTVLGKRKAVRDSVSLVLYLASGSESSHALSDSDFEPQALSGKTLPPLIINGKVVENTKKKYRCTYQGCTKAYTKPARLQEHERSHTGEVNCFFIHLTQLTHVPQRPFVCETCNKSYLRETHLQAHSRSHLPESARPFSCPELNCEKRFWTTQHLRAHEDMHKGAKPYSVSYIFASSGNAHPLSTVYGKFLSRCIREALPITSSHMHCTCTSWNKALPV